MAHLERKDLPFHYALADAFTVCDAYHCSMLGPTDPNRYYMWTGWDGNDGQGRRPGDRQRRARLRLADLPRAPAGGRDQLEDLPGHGDGPRRGRFLGLDVDDPYIGNYGDNSLLYFHQYQNAAPGARSTRRPAPGPTSSQTAAASSTSSQADVKGGKLPQVSWIVAPEAYTEHPAWPAGYGAWYTAAGARRADQRPRGVVQDGPAHHVRRERRLLRPRRRAVSRTSASLAGQSTVPLDNELFDGTAGTPGGSNGVVGPYGLGVRVPMSWSRRGARAAGSAQRSSTTRR